MAQFKICPTCGTKNEIEECFCDNCGTDIAKVTISEDNPSAQDNNNDYQDSAEKQSDSEDPLNKLEGESKTLGKGSKTCPKCGYSNPVHKRKCEKCREDLSNVPWNEGSTEIMKVSSGNFVLSADDGAFSVDIKEGCTILGRSGYLCEYLNSKAWVSRQHAELKLEQGNLYIRDYKSTNGTFVNMEKVGTDTFIELKAGDIVSLGGIQDDPESQCNAAVFTVKNKSCM